MSAETLNTNSTKVGAVLVIGGGIGGIQASLDLAQAGFKVYLVDSSSAIGGVMSQLDKTFPTNDCSMCIMAPKLVECGRDLNIEVIAHAEIERIEGQPGDFEVVVVKKPRYIDVEKCTGCSLCAQHCPVRAVDAYNRGLSRRTAIYIDYPQAVPLAYIIDRDKCIGCGLCESICMPKAIKFDDREELDTLHVGAVILTPGFDEFDARIKSEYGYGKYRNVLTSIEFERMLSASGPSEGHLFRPSDGDVPKKIAFIQCVGSRDASCGNTYCSSVCCMYATKEAIIAKEHVGDIESTVFFMDMRAYGKGFDAYYQAAKEEHGVRYIRCRASSVEEVPETKNLRIRYETEDGTLMEEEFDLVVLSVGFEPPRGAQKLAEELGIELNGYGFCETDGFSPLSTSKPGIFVGGAFTGPKDIPETVVQASGAASMAAALLAPVRGTEITRKEYPPEKEVRGQPPRIGVFICHCGINIAGVVDVPEVARYARTLDDVVCVEDNLYTCSQDTQERIKEVIEENGLNRVVVASCTPRTHEPLFRETVKEAGLNEYLFEMANIRDQCSWVHMRQPEEATEKAKDLTGMAVAKARLIAPLDRLSSEVIPRGLVIGGGLSGMTAALSLVEQGFEVYLVEKEKELGGNLRQVHRTLEGRDVQEYLRSIVEKVEANELIHVYTDAEIKEIEGYVGNFKTTLVKADLNPKSEIRNRSTERSRRSPKSEIQVEHGIVIVATGGKEYRPVEYLYGTDDRIITQTELERRLATSHASLPTLHSVVMIQCVGSRSDERLYCSRVCCSQAMKNALEIREKSPGANVYILYKDIRTYGFREDYYRRALAEGVLFIRYDDDRRPQVSLDEGQLQVSVTDPILNEEFLIHPDLLVLSAAILPNENGELAKMLKVPLTEYGFFLEAHVKLRPIDFATDGVFLCGLAHSTKFIDECLSQAYGVGARAATILSKDRVEGEGVVARSEEDLCRGCERCREICAFNAIELVRTEEGMDVARINAIACKGCGRCSVVCPSGAITVPHFTNDQVNAMVEAALFYA